MDLLVLGNDVLEEQRLDLTVIPLFLEVDTIHLLCLNARRDIAWISDANSPPSLPMAWLRYLGQWKWLWATLSGPRLAKSNENAQSCGLTILVVFMLDYQISSLDHPYKRGKSYYCANSINLLHLMTCDQCNKILVLLHHQGWCDCQKISSECPCL